MSSPATIDALLAAAAGAAADAPALRYRDETLTYADWHHLAGQLAGALRERGIGCGDVVALWLPSTPLYHVAYLAGARLGAVTTGINLRYRRHEVRHLLQQSGAKLLLAVNAAHGSDFVGIVGELRAELPELAEVLWADAEALRHGTADVVRALAADTDAEVPADASAPDDPVAIVFTSGTTGVPKGAWYSHRNLLALAEIENRRYRDGAVPFQKHLAAGLSFAHMGTMLRIALHIGHRAVSLIHDSFDPGAVLATIERERLPHLGAIPTQMTMLLDHPERPQRDLSSLRSILLGGAASSPDLIRRIVATFAATVSVRYSSTEVGIATASLPEDPIERLVSTVGKPTPGVELTIVGEDGAALAVGDVGEVVVRSPATMRGYWRAAEATAQAIDPQGRVHTGDAGYLDADGYLHLQGRRSEMYIRGGYNVHPEEVEGLLARHPLVARAAVVGVPDEQWGAIGWAYVVPRDPEHPPTLGELRAFVGAEMASFKRPEGLSLVEDLPLTPMFKLDRAALRRLRTRKRHSSVE